MKTLLLCFIHGFRGDEETFYDFPKVCSINQAMFKADLNCSLEESSRYRVETPYRHSGENRRVPKI